MTTTKKASAALISVFHKDGLEPIVRKLDELGVTLYSTGGTEKFIKDLGINVVPVEEVTDYPSILGGRVKTLHPKVFGGILNRQDNDGDVAQMTEYDIPQLDIVIVDLYPFEKTVASGASEQDIIEKIDIGGISLIRAAAKNYKDVLCVSSMEDYAKISWKSLQNAEWQHHPWKKENAICTQRLSMYPHIMIQLSSIISMPRVIETGSFKIK